MLETYLRENGYQKKDKFCIDDIDKSSFDTCSIVSSIHGRHDKMKRLPYAHQKKKNGYSKACFEGVNLSDSVSCSSDFCERANKFNQKNESKKCTGLMQKIIRNDCAKINKKRDNNFRCSRGQNSSDGCGAPIFHKDYENNSSNCDSFCDFLWESWQTSKKSCKSKKDKKTVRCKSPRKKSPRPKKACSESKRNSCEKCKKPKASLGDLKNQKQASSEFKDLKCKSASQLADNDCDDMSSSYEISSLFAKLSGISIQGSKSPVQSLSKHQLPTEECKHGLDAYEELAICYNENWLTMRVLKDKPKTKGCDNQKKLNSDDSDSEAGGEPGLRGEHCCASMSAIDELRKQTIECDCTPPKPKNAASYCCVPGFPVDKKKIIDDDTLKLDREGCYKTCGNDGSEMLLVQLTTKRACDVKQHTVDIELKMPRETPCIKSNIEICGRKTQVTGARIDRGVKGCRLPPRPDPCDYWPSRITMKDYKRYLRTQRLYY